MAGMKNNVPKRSSCPARSFHVNLATSFRSGALKKRIMTPIVMAPSGRLKNVKSAYDLNTHRRLDAVFRDRLYDYKRVDLLDIEAPPPGRFVCKDTPKKRACHASNAVHCSDETTVHRTLA
jgi:hypothetical protein